MKSYSSQIFCSYDPPLIRGKLNRSLEIHLITVNTSSFAFLEALELYLSLVLGYPTLIQSYLEQ